LEDGRGSLDEQDRIVVQSRCSRSKTEEAFMKIPQFLLLLLSISFLGPTPSRAQDAVWPSSWQGIWDFSHKVSDCGGGPILDSYTERDTICAGDPILETGQDCSGTISDPYIHVVCSRPEAYFDCIWTVETTLSVRRSEDTISGSIQTAYSSSIEYCSASCRVDIVSATLVSAGSHLCAPVRGVDESWGTLKASYK
jgi:hypothetical protein